MHSVNIARPLEPSRMEQLSDAEFVTWNWGNGSLPDRFKAPTLANGKLVRNEYDAYWASQPPEVQALMDLPEADKGILAKELADKGYRIDVPIMLWNWDPLATMVTRRNQGFTWVPSANMRPVEVGPGLSFPGKPMYDPNIPAGGIKVTIEWAKGFEHTSPWMQGQAPEQF